MTPSNCSFNWEPQAAAFQLRCYSRSSAAFGPAGADVEDFLGIIPHDLKMFDMLFIYIYIMVSLVVIYLYHRCGWLGSFGEFDPAPTSKNHYTAITQATDRIQNVVSLSCNTCFKRVNSSLQSESIIKYDYRSKMLRSPIWALVNPFSLSPRSTSKSLAHNERGLGLETREVFPLVYL